MLLRCEAFGEKNAFRVLCRRQGEIALNELRKGYVSKVYLGTCFE